MSKTRISFSATESKNQTFLEGFSIQEPEGRWTVGSRALLRLPLPANDSVPEQMVIDAISFGTPTNPVRRVRFSVNGTQLSRASYPLASNAPEVRLDLTEVRTLEAGSDFLLAIDIENPVSPSELSLNEDKRKLGIFVKSIEFSRSEPTRQFGFSRKAN